MSASKRRLRLLISSALASCPESIPPVRSSDGPPHCGLETRIDRQMEAAEVAARSPERMARLAGEESPSSPPPAFEAWPIDCVEPDHQSGAPT